MEELDGQDGADLGGEEVEVRTLTLADLEWITRIDEKHSGRSRREFFRVKLHEALTDTGIRISLAADVWGKPAGFLMGRLYHGEFGEPEAVAILDSIGVDPAQAGKHVGRMLLQQLCNNLRALGIEKLCTEVDWEQGELIRFFQREGFRLAPRLCLELVVSDHEG